MTLRELNALTAAAATAELLRCCGSTVWARQMSESRPFSTPASMATTADRLWTTLGGSDWLEAFAARPRIGSSLEPLRGAEGEGGTEEASCSGYAERYGAKASTSGGGAPRELENWSTDEQRGVASATGEVRERLRRRNDEYEQRFGYIFIVCATGKAADEMLAIVEGRLLNDPDRELAIAAEEQRKITRIRLAKLLGANSDPLP